MQVFIDAALRTIVETIIQTLILIILLLFECETKLILLKNITDISKK